jgi:multisubunit Na+/H+ antiporter MnhB subunit
MKWVYIVSITTLVILMFIFQWPKIKTVEKNEKIAFITLTVLGWAIAIFYVIFPSMPSPAKIVDFTLMQISNIFRTLW